VYVGLTIMRTMRDDFGVEIWQALGVDKQPEVFAQSETLVAIVATLLNALAICIVGNLAALTATSVMMSFGFLTVAVAALLQWYGNIAPFPFMVACGLGLYVPYVAFHTTVFERLIAASPQPGNLGFLMYLADSIGYLGYAAIVTWKIVDPPGAEFFEWFRKGMLVISLTCIVALAFALRYFLKTLALESGTPELVSEQPGLLSADQPLNPAAATETNG
jgi:hypothetical protein